MLKANEFDDIWDVDDVCLVPEDANIYLSDPKKGLELIAKLMEFKKPKGVKSIKRLEYVLDTQLIKSLSLVGLSGEIELHKQLLRLSDRLFERKRLQMLNSKTVIGIGGKFSAGKSCFINSILPRPLLPENQTPTTSIPTYIVAGESDDIQAFTYSDNDVHLTETEAQALTHSFYDKYNLGFSQFVSNLAINVKNFGFTNIAILDTPGYSKEDSGIKQSITDSSKAYLQLKSVDFIIWLIDIENGTISNPDIEFLRSISPENPILMVFNKCDKKTEKDVSSIIEQTKEVLLSSGIPVYDVIAYSSLYPEEYDSTQSLPSFLRQADEYNNQKESIDKRIEKIIKTISHELYQLEKQTKGKCNAIGAAIQRSDDPMDIKAMVIIYAELIKEIRTIKDGSKKFSDTCQEIGDLLSEIKIGGR